MILPNVCYKKDANSDPDGAEPGVWSRGFVDGFSICTKQLCGSAQSQLTIKIPYSKESAGSKLEVEASALGVLDEGLVAKLESSRKLLVVSPLF